MHGLGDKRDCEWNLEVAVMKKLGCTYAVYERRNILIRGRRDPRQVGHLVQRALHHRDALNHGVLICGVAEIRSGHDARVHVGLDGHAAAGGGSGAEVLGYSHGGWEVGVSIMHIMYIRIGMEGSGE